MAVRGFDPVEERKSYGTIFFLGVCLLVGLSLWALYDDNFTRRPWKRYQAEFYRMDYAKAQAAYGAEDKKLQTDPKYQELAKKIAVQRASLDGGELATRLARLLEEEKVVDIRFNEVDQEVKFIKSGLEEVWYEYDHAIQQGRGVRVYEDRIKQLDAEQAGLEPELEKVRQQRLQVKEQIKAVQSNVKDLEAEISNLARNRDRWIRVMDNATVSLGPVSLYKIPKIEQVVLTEFDRNNFDKPVARVDRCQSCHKAINRPGFENEPHPFRTHPRREVLLADNAHPPEKFGCTACHQGQGVAVNSIEQAHGEVKYWEYPLLRGAKVQSSCAACHQNVQPHQDAKILAQGQRLFEQIGCTGCHLVEGHENIPKVGPSLRRISAKVDPSWAISWIQDPHKFRSRTRMPNFGLNEDQAVAIASYLWTRSKTDGDKWLKDHPLPAGYRGQADQLVTRGRELVNSIGCKGCHGFADGEFSTALGTNKDLIPNLKDVAAKVGPQWTYHWLKNPRDFSPDTRMPSLRLTDQEALSITAYLMTLGGKGAGIRGIEQRLADAGNAKRGEALIRKYGCFGCHDIPGMEKESRIGVELTTFGSKFLEELSFGNRKDIHETWDDWTFNKLKTPRIYITPRVDQLMPQFNLSDEDAKALRVLLATFKESEVPAGYAANNSEEVMNIVEGRRLMHQYNCIGCHTIESRGGFVQKYYENKNLAPPNLNGEGEKVQSNWLFAFLKAPIPVRPWLQIRMPSFGFSDEETNLLVSYFNGLSKVRIPYVHFDDGSVPPEHIPAARRMFSKDYFDCLSCHQQGEKKPEGPPEGWAPDLTLARSRLNPYWVIKWLQDPQKVQPGTKMPSYYPGGPDDILGGKDDRQIEALRDYIMTLGRSGAAGG